MNKVSFFTPIYRPTFYFVDEYSKKPLLHPNSIGNRWCNFVEGFFDWGGNRAEVLREPLDGKRVALIYAPNKKSSSSWIDKIANISLLTAIKVACYATVAIPLLMLGLRSVIRYFAPVHVADKKVNDLIAQHSKLSYILYDIMLAADRERERTARSAAYLLNHTAWSICAEQESANVLKQPITNFVRSETNRWKAELSNLSDNGFTLNYKKNQIRVTFNKNHLAEARWQDIQLQQAKALMNAETEATIPKAAFFPVYKTGSETVSVLIEEVKPSEQL